MTATRKETEATEKSDREQAILDELRSRGPIPGHIAIIMDGNGRWAKERGLPRVKGHREGAASVRDVVEGCAELGVNHLTLYTFSTENWNRPATEVNALMKLLIHTLRREAATLQKNHIRLNAIGNLDMLPTAARRELDEVMAATASNSRMTIHLALSYSGRWEIVQAARRLADDLLSGRLDPTDIDDETIASRLTTASIPDPDLLIRTGGEIRISNFLLWQLAYTELFFTRLFWPAFRKADLHEAIRSFQDRERRFGTVGKS